ncbi:hypothetical protein QN412_02895 [Pseudomonas sp. RTB3]|uniref:hypothetical protein n=1 Tax=unclassified Pseudomonas TaxID=196821 RepID=UPI002B2395E7|nr:MULTISPECIES: hypothetical protein [unclassified Pseudomonas]MEB0008179.1 hypothetical protein [Pseudomonas sp. RTB2]MEB0015901.1 hypothetical protein [Pseudomonas sp. RTB3]MEB0270885.1 hypothetical protein [Pseudomonas sp. 5B4]
MPTENKIAEPAPSLATGHDLNAATWADFVQRLRHDCVGERVRDHCTAAAIFIVEARRIVCGLNMDYTDKRLVYWDSGESVAYSIHEYWLTLDRREKSELNKRMQNWSECQFMKASENDQWYVLDGLSEHTVTGWDDRWEYVNAHFTHAAAEAFIKRKKHDYRDGMRVYVNSQYYAWEFNAIKEAILDGTLTYTPKVAA